MEKFTFENVESAQGATVKVVGQNGDVELEISSVERTKLNGDEWNAFCVRLKGKADEPLSQGTYKLEHEAFGEAELFLSPNSETEYEIHIAQQR
ncbi:hypothetical protein HH219_08400 [Pseudoalteromonas sp. NEC-BIFX-2020_015]|uniref:DUF6916 family protein n=1 Tax=Pseudoalteromonas sp. NEC-BIFX-2020_015 TaxID=2729544 RepID=UPI00146149AE|nr:hypothetical protein [Pseudoalteromonas sp. NEC-BIFX-2020_015]NMR25544.1 hypothetical protein [Pseudoalteromonas sp. NEC-BIFX-2020_015]